MSDLPQSSVRNRLLAKLSPDDFSRLQPSFEPVTLRRGVVLIAPDQPIEHVYFLGPGSPPSSRTRQAAGGSRSGSPDETVWPARRSFSVSIAPRTRPSCR